MQKPVETSGKIAVAQITEFCHVRCTDRFFIVVDGAVLYLASVSAMFELFASAAEAVTAVNGVTVITIIKAIRHANSFLNVSFTF